MNDKIEAEDSFEDVIKKMSEGNPGAMNVLTRVVKEEGHMEFMKFSLQLDLMRMYGSDIWLGYKDYCDEDIDEYFDMVMDTDEDLQEFVDNYPESVN